ncbi:MAG: cupredoxin domain-containing protein [Patescibacteria group bacterium]|nr:cupredoxin domain-containing protein [Patescibacteria group bacterium]
MQVIGIILILIIIALFVYYFKWSRKEEKAVETEAGQQVTVVVKGAYSPNLIKAKAGKPLTIVFDRQEDSSCSKKVIFKDFDISEELPDFGQKEITVTPKATGEYQFSCEMGMYQGKITAE